MADKYWTGSLPLVDDFGIPYRNLMFDGRTKQGPWAKMSEVSWKRFGCGKLGTGYGQKYERILNTNNWLKIEG